MKRILIFTLIFILSVAATGCGSDTGTPAAVEQAAPVAQSASALTEDYANALPIRNQLTLGILQLENDSALAITAEQAATFLPLWQALGTLTNSGTGAQAEIDALLSQIEGQLTATQLKAIADMHLSREDTQRVAQEWGISGENGGGDGSGGGQNMTEDERATRRAERGVTDDGQSGGVSAALLDRLVQLLTERAK